MSKSTPTPGPASPAREVEAFTGAVPGPLAMAGDDVSLDQLSPEEIRARILARERDMKHHVEALKHEALAVIDDVNVGGRPLMDVIRGNPIVALAATAGAGALVGLLVGLRARAKRRPPADDEIDFVRARLALAIEDASQRVAEGARMEDALKKSMNTVPMMYGDPSTLPPRERSTRKQALDVVVTSAAGFAAKTALDMITKRLTGHEETFAAVADATD